MTDLDCDVAIVGGGPGGYVCAIACAQRGLRTVCIEKRETLGGTCLNVGCIPSKALLHSSHLFELAGHGFAGHGIAVEGLSLDLGRMMARKDRVVADLTKGIDFLFRKNGVRHLRGHGRFAGHGQLEVRAGDGSVTRVKARRVVIATGSEPAALPGVAFDEERILTSTGALALDRVPAHLVVVGAGYIGLELGTVWRRLGAKVTVVEFLDRITPGMDAEVAKQFQRILAKQGLVFRLGTKVTGARKGDEGVTLTVESAKGGKAEEIVADVVLVAIGRRAYTEGLGLAEVGVQLDERGRVKTTNGFATSVPGIWAIGDVIAGPMLAHKAEDEGVALAETLAGQHPHVNYEAIPGVVYTWPEVASVGATEEELKSRGVAYKAGRFPFSANGRARAMGETDGFVKILADAATDRLLGAHILGPDAGTLIAELALAIEFGASSEDVARTSHAHPSLNEAVKEAALAAHGKPLHL
jgi:dihydrolipoamide dehydrogenase